MLRGLTADRDAVRGAVWMTVASLFVAAAAGCVRELSGAYSVVQLVFLRSVIGVTLLSPWMWRMSRRGTLGTARLPLYGLRTVLSYSGMVCLFYGFANMPLGEVYSLMFLVPLITILLAVFLLRERAGPHAMAACAVGFAGALVVLRPGIVSVSLAAAAVLYTAVAYAGVNICIKSLARTDSPVQITIYGHAIALPLAFVPAMLVWKTPTWEDLPLILALGVCQLLSALFHARSVSAADARIVQPFNFLRLPFTVIVGWIAFAELPSNWTWLGAAMIFAASYYALYSEGRARKRASRP
jgi:drug/metabolite transporter (DMT)-like permease